MVHWCVEVLRFRLIGLSMPKIDTNAFWSRQRSRTSILAEEGPIPPAIPPLACHAPPPPKQPIKTNPSFRDLSMSVHNETLKQAQATLHSPLSHEQFAKSLEFNKHVAFVCARRFLFC